MPQDFLPHSAPHTGPAQAQVPKTTCCLASPTLAQDLTLAPLRPIPVFWAEVVGISRAERRRTMRTLRCLVLPPGSFLLKCLQVNKGNFTKPSHFQLLRSEGRGSCPSSILTHLDEGGKRGRKCPRPPSRWNYLDQPLSSGSQLPLWIPLWVFFSFTLGRSGCFSTRRSKSNF